MTRTRAAPAIDPTEALTRPACAPAAESGVKVPLAIVPLRFSSVQVASPALATGCPFASKPRTLNASGVAGLMICSVGVTRIDASGPGDGELLAPDNIPALGVVFGPMANMLSIDAT